MADNIEVIGVGFALDEIDRTVADLEARVNEELQYAAIEMEAEAKQRAPVGTPESTGIKGYKGGRLRASIKYTPKYLEFLVHTNVFYAPFVEFGTKFMKARPFMFPAFEIARRHLLEALRKL